MRSMVAARPARRADADLDATERSDSGWRYCLGVFLVVRVCTLVLSVVGVGLVPPRSDVGAPGWHHLLTAFDRFDAAWFSQIAERGYTAGDASAAFFPLYPMVMRIGASVLPVDPLWIGLAISNLAFLGSLLLLYRLTGAEFSDAVARRSVLYLAIFPTSFFLLAPYSESLFLCLVLLSFIAARERRWIVAGLAGTLAASTRSIGLVLVLVLLAEAFLQRRERREARILVPILGSLTVLIGPLLYLLYWGSRTSFLAPFGAQHAWEREWAVPLVVLGDALALAIRSIGAMRHGFWMIDVIVVAIALAAATYGLRRLRATYSIYVWASLLVPLTYPFPPRPLLSLPRFAVVMFPLFWSLAIVADHRPMFHQWVLIASGMGYGITAILFMNWYPAF